MEYKTLEEGVKGKVAIITGGASGMGKACVKLFTYFGVNVATLDINVEKGRELEEEINAKGRGRLKFFECDVRNEERLRETIDLTVQEFGKLDILVNCAGVFPLQRPIDMVSVQEYKDILDLNLVPYFTASKYALPYLRSTKGCIINFGSVLGITGDEGALAYCSAKGAIENFTRSLAIDEARNGVRVNEVKPGHMNTEMFFKTASEQADPEGFIKYSDSLQWMGRGGEPEEVAYTVLFLASDWASFITGADIRVTGGYELGEGPKVPNPYLAWGEMVKK